MLTKFKKTVAAILVMTMFTAMFTIAPAAVETNNEKPTSDAMNYSVAGNNDLGDILADEIMEYQSQNDNSDCSYTISEITVAENVATVTYSAEKDCTILVAVYDENTDKMLASGRAEALAKTNSAVVTIETDSMPKNFVLRGFILSDSNAPMSEAYHSNMYTTDMQALLQSTVDDYEPEKVLNIDDDTTTNFMVYSDDVQKFECNDNVNTIEKADSNGDSYVFTNADDKLKGLKPGDIFACDDNPQNPIIFKIDEISTEGDTVTIKTAEASLEQAFECVKIESNGSADDAQIDESMVSPGMKYVGASKDKEATADKKPISSVGASYDGDSVGALIDVDKKEEYEHEFEIGDLGKEIEGKYVKFEGKLGGSISVGGAVNVSIYLTISGKKSVSLSADFKAYYKLYVEGSFNFDVPFVQIPIPVAAKALVVEFDIAFVVEASGKFEVACETSCSIGFNYASGKGFKNTSRAPKVDYSTNVEGELYVAFKLTVAVVTGDKDIGSVSLNAEIGADITASPTTPNININGVTVNHDCKKCVSGDISLVLKIYPEVVFLKKNVIKSISDDIKKDFEYKKKLTPWYYSFTHKDFGFDICRYANVSFNIKVVKDGAAVENAEIMDILNGVYFGTTDNTGKLYVTLDGNDNGLYQIHADKDNIEASAAIRINPFNDILALENQEWKSFKKASNYKDGCYEIELGSNNVPEPTTEPTTIPEETEPIVTEPQVQLLDSGKCGDNITYEYYSDGTLKLNGTGAMYNYDLYTDYYDRTRIEPPWYSYNSNIRKLDISKGITIIGAYAFQGTSGLTSVNLPMGITEIGYQSFADSGLKNIDIPNSVTWIRDRAFQSCSDLTIVIPESISRIDEKTFFWCKNINLTLPKNLTYVDNSAFEECTGVAYFKGGVPEFYFSFFRTHMTFYYPKGDVTWASFDHNYNGTYIYLYPYDYENNMVVTEDETAAKSAKADLSSVSAQNETVTTRTAEYSNETAYAYYIIAAVKDETAEDVLSADNLIYIIQTTADEKGNISSDLAIPADVTDYDVVLYGPGSLSVSRIRIGDVNLNGEIQIDDVTHLQKNIAKITTLSKDARAAADCDGNGDINIKDATLIQMYLAGFETNGRVGECINNDKAATTEPETTEPVTTEPVTTVPVTTVPATTAPVTTEPVTEPTATASTYTMTFTNNRNWDKVCCYYWSGDTNNNWPGTEMTYSYTNDFGEKIYTIEIPDTAQNVIFNNGGNGQQTVDITVTGSAKYYISGGSGNSYTVGNW